MADVIKKEIEFAGRTMSLETGRVAFQANSAVIIRYGDTEVLVTVTSSEPREDIDFFPLRVDYEERLYAGGLIKSSRFIKREGRPSDDSILSGRIIDRVIRPLFPRDYFDDIQVIATVLSVDGENDPRILSLIAAIAALEVSDIPWDGPLGAVGVGLKDGKFIVNPTNGEMEGSVLDLVVAASREKVVMIEAGANEVSEDRIFEALEFAHQHIQKIIDFISEFKKAAQVEKYAYESKALSEEVLSAVKDFVTEDLKELVTAQVDKTKFAERFTQLEEKTHQEFEGKYTKSDMTRALKLLEKEVVRKLILEEKRRPDGRALDEIRNISIEVGLLPRTHGSALFTRGMTQALTIATLGSTSLEQLIQSMEGEETKRYIHHYYGLPFSYGEVAPLRGPGRRDIGHGALAEKALLPVIPDTEHFPYTIRLVSEILSQNGSTSMAATCGSSLALMDAGVPIKTHIGGISIGLVEDNDNFVILTDIAGVEDMCGDLDFKMAGSRAGVTAIQLDIKNRGLTFEILKEAIQRSQQARMRVLDAMEGVIQAPRTSLSEYAPRITQIKIDPKKIGDVIGSGGKVIKGIIEKTGVAIDVQEDGNILISSTEEEKAKQAKEIILGITKEVKVGEIYEGTVVRITEFGAMVKILPNREGRIHISELEHRHVNRVEDVVRVGDKVRVKVIDIDYQGRINLSKKALEPKSAHQQGRPASGPEGPGSRRGKHVGYRTPYYKRPGYRR